ncbi:hypothetical protein Tco_0162076 [Tanacetum coccineum]
MSVDSAKKILLLTTPRPGGSRYHGRRYLCTQRRVQEFCTRIHDASEGSCICESQIDFLMEEEARLSRAAWAQSMDVCDQTHSEGILLRTTVMTQQSEIVELRAADQRRQTVISELLKADYRRQRQLVETLKIVKSLKAQMTELQRQQGPAKDPAEPELPEEASSSS